MTLKKYFQSKLVRQSTNLTSKRFYFSRHIKLLNGDSEVCLEQILKDVHEPTLFWLDTHYSAGVTEKGRNNTPIEKELAIIKKYCVYGSIIAIDDAHLFVGCDGYSDKSKLFKTLKSINKDFKIVIKKNIFLAK